MEEYHKSTEPIFNSMKTLLKGEVDFVEKLDNWSIETEVKWNKKMINMTLKSRKSDLKSEFISCKLSQFHFFTLLSYVTRARSDSYSFYGTKSKYSDLILKSPITTSLMEAKNATIKLEGKYLIFSGGIRKKDKTSLSNIFKLNEMLIQEIDTLK